MRTLTDSMKIMVLKRDIINLKISILPICLSLLPGILPVMPSILHLSAISSDLNVVIVNFFEFHIYEFPPNLVTHGFILKFVANEW